MSILQCMLCMYGWFGSTKMDGRDVDEEDGDSIVDFLSALVGI